MNMPDPHTEFPADGHEARHLARAFEMLESDKMDALLRQHGIRREAMPLAAQRGGRFPAWAWAVAASLVLVLAAVLFLGRSPATDPQQFADAQLTTIAADYNPVLRSTGKAAPIETAKQAFSRADWSAAAVAFDLALAETQPSETARLEEIYFYKGLIELELGNFPAAAEQFSRSLATGAGNLEKDARWLRGLALVKSGQVQAAAADLEKTAAEKGWVKAAEARQLLDLMKSDGAASH
ncbi:MAG: hypothetical protein ACK4Q5_04050 [Saprospiraceae bacterium]